MTSSNIMAADSTAERPFRRGAMLFVLLTGQAMATIDNSIVNVAAPAIRTDIGATGAAADDYCRLPPGLRCLADYSRSAW